MQHATSQGRAADLGLAVVLQVEADGQLEVELHGGALELAPQGVEDRDVDLGPVEGAVALVQLRGQPFRTCAVPGRVCDRAGCGAVCSAAQRLLCLALQVQVACRRWGVAAGPGNPRTSWLMMTWPEPQTFDLGSA